MKINFCKIRILKKNIFLCATVNIYLYKKNIKIYNFYNNIKKQPKYN